MLAFTSLTLEAPSFSGHGQRH